jgi:type VI secretion system secreted protein VgrG
MLRAIALLRFPARLAVIVPFAAVLYGPPTASATSVLDTAAAFAVLAGASVTNTGSSTLQGDVGVSPGTAVTGFPPGTVIGGTIHAADAVAAQAQTDLTTAYTTLAGLPFTTDLTGTDLGGLVLTPGVYHFDTAAQLTGALALDAAGQPDATFVFQIGSTLTTASASSVVLLNPGPNAGAFFQVGSSATLGTTTAFNGNILALTSITLNTGATIGCGSALARNGSVTLDSNVISVGCSGAGNGGPQPVPQPSTLFLLGSSVAAMSGLGWRRVSRAGSRLWSL